MAFCKKCGTELIEGFLMCPKCGEPIPVEETKEEVVEPIVAEETKQEIVFEEVKQPEPEKEKTVTQSYSETVREKYMKFFGSPWVLALCIAVSLNSLWSIISIILYTIENLQIGIAGTIEIMIHIFLIVGCWIVYVKSRKGTLNDLSLIRPAVKAQNIAIILSLILAALCGILCSLFILIDEDIEGYLKTFMTVNMLIAFAFPIYITFFKSLLEFLQKTAVGIKVGIKKVGGSPIFAAVMLFIFALGSIIFLFAFNNPNLLSVLRQYFYENEITLMALPILYMVIPQNTDIVIGLFEPLLMIYAGVVLILFKKKIK